MIVLFGANGMLGTEIAEIGQGAGLPMRLLTQSDLDLSDRGIDFRPWIDGATVVINATAYTKVDLAETETELNNRLNAEVPGELAAAAEAAGASFLHFSTDYVFDGHATHPISENTPSAPVNAYGAAKREGEVRVLAHGGSLMRTSWLFGAHGPCFPKTMLRLAREHGALRVVNDQFGCPTSAADLAHVALHYFVDGHAVPGQVMHAVGPDAMDWRSFAEVCLQTFREVAPGLLGEVPIEGIPTEAFPTPARRPGYSVLSTGILDSTGLTPMPPIHASLKSFWRKCIECGLVNV